MQTTSIVKHRRTPDPGKPPPNGTLPPGMLAIEMSSQPSPRLWVGVDQSIDPTGRRLVQLSGGGATVISGTTPPLNPIDNQLWWDAGGGQLYLRYNDGNSAQWVIASPSFYGSGGGGTMVSIGAVPPAGPTPGQQWWDTIGGQMYIWYVDGGSGQWVICSPSFYGGGGDPSAGPTVWGSITGTLSAQSDLNAALNGKQAALVSGSNIRTINGNSLLGNTDLVISGSGATVWGGITGTLSAQADLAAALNGKQAVLISGQNIRTINGNSLLGNTDLVISAGPVSGLPLTGGTLSDPAQPAGANYGPLTLRAVGGFTGPTPNSQFAQIIYTVVDNNNQAVILHSFAVGATPGSHFEIRDVTRNKNPLTIWGGTSLSDPQNGEVHILENDLLCHYGLLVAGDLVTGGLTYPSDRRLKQNIASWEIGLDAVRRLNPISFEYNGLGGRVADGRMRVGLDADDTAKIIPEMVGERRLGEFVDAKTIAPDTAVFALINAVKELAGRLDALEARFA